MARGKRRTRQEIEELVQTLIPVLQRGTTLKRACKYLKISDRTIYSYMSKYAWVCTEIEAAQNFLLIKAESVWAEKIQAGDYQASKEYLERKLKGEYSLRQEITGEDGQPIEIQVIKKI